MVKVHPVQLSMTRGEVTPFVHARADTEHYALGLAVARNWLVMRYGGITRRPGTFFDNSTKLPARRSVFRSFNFSQAQNYALEFGHLYVRFHTINGRVETGGVPVEVVTPYTEADIDNIQTQQAGDVLYIACKGYAIRELRRNSETSWALTVYASDFGPYLAEPTDNQTSMTPGAFASAVPSMTSPTLPTGTATASTFTADAWKVFDKSPGTDWVDSTTSAGNLAYTFATTPRVVDAYWIRASSVENPTGVPATWDFQGYNGTQWVTLDSRAGESGFTGGETRFYEFVNSVPYAAYRLNWTGTGFTGGAESRVAELGLHESPVTQPDMTLTANSVTNINGNVGFLPSDVGRWIQLLGGDGRWRDFKVSTYVSALQVTGKLYGHALPNLSPIRRWRLGAFSGRAEDSPSVVSMYESRLITANTPNNPLDIWFSKSANFHSNGVSVPVVDDDAVNVRMSNGQLNEVLWAVEAGDLLVGTAGGLRVVGRNDPGKAFSPSNTRQKGQTGVRASQLQPIVIERTVLFSEIHERALYESAFSYEADGYVALELTMLAEHLFTSGIKQMAYQDTPSKVLWVVMNNGTMAACTYDREQKVFGVCPAVTIGGSYESVVVLPGDTYDVPMFIVKRGARRDIERMSDPFRVGKSLYTIPVYFDGCTIYQGAATTVIVNLTQLAGLTVGYWADGADRGNITVSAAGRVDFPAAYSNIVIGRRYVSRGETLRLAQAGNQDGGIMGRKARVVEGYLDMLETYGVRAGSRSAYERTELELMRSTRDAELRPVVPSLHTGFIKMHTDDSWDHNGVYVFETDSGYPATIRSIMTSVETEP